MEISIVIENIFVAQIIDYLENSIFNLIVKDSFSYYNNHHLHILDLTKEFKYNYEFLKSRNKLDDDDFLNKTYNINLKYSAIILESINLNDDITKKISEEFARNIFDFFKCNVFIFEDDSSIPYLSLEIKIY